MFLEEEYELTERTKDSDGPRLITLMRSDRVRKLYRDKNDSGGCDERLLEAGSGVTCSFGKVPLVKFRDCC